MNVHFKIKKRQANALGVDVGSWKDGQEIIRPLSEVVVLPTAGQRIVLESAYYNAHSVTINYDTKEIHVFVEKSFF